MLTLYTFGPALGLPDPSPFVMKTMGQMNLFGVAHQVKSGMAGMRRAPKGKLPFIDDDGTVIADSTLITEHLQHSRGLDFGAGYGDYERGIAYAVEKMLEESVYFVGMHNRWIKPAGWETTKTELLGVVPRAARWLVFPRIQKRVASTLHFQGTGRHTPDEIDRIGERGVEALSRVLSDKPFLVGDRPCGADCTALGFLLTGSCAAYPTRLRDAILTRDNLVAYMARMKPLAFPDFAWA